MTATALTLSAFGSPAGRKNADTLPSTPLAAPPDSADHLIFWVDCNQVVGLTDAELDTWKSRGVDGFVCMMGRLQGLGGTQDFTPLRNSNIVARAKARGMKMYLGFKLSNYFNLATPLSDWFDDAAWSNLVLPDIKQLGAGAKALGFAGLALDQEMYAQVGGVNTASWDWNYPGNTHPEAEVRSKARQRGQQVMGAILSGFPGAELMAYDAEFPGAWDELVQGVVNGKQAAYSPRLDVNFWDGMTSVEGYGAIRLVDAIFYKAPHLGTWDTALQYNVNALASLFSQHFSDWKYASSRLFVSPFSWIDAGPNPSEFDDAQPPQTVRDQLLAFRKWGMGGEFPNYAYADPRSFDYSPYVSAMQEASTPATVDSESPKLAVTTNWAGSKPPQLFEGTAQDNLAVWAVRWHDDRGGSGVAKLNWQVMSGDYNSGYVGQTHWSFPASDLRRGATQVSFTAQDIKGHTTTQGACALLKLGRNRADRLRGTRQGDRLVGRSGNDKLLGRAGQDCLLGGRGRDKLKGGSGNDHLIGGPGSDLLISRGGGRDTIRCGPGRHDRAVVDRKDRIRGRGCEIVRRRR